MDETMRILTMIESGAVSADQGARLLAALHKDYDKKCFRVVVDSPAGDKVNVQLPVGGLKKLLAATGQLPLPEAALQGLDVPALLEAVKVCLDQQTQGDFVNVRSADGTLVRVYVE